MLIGIACLVPLDGLAGSGRLASVLGRLPAWHWDKVAHALAFGLLSVLVFLAWREGPIAHRVRATVVLVISYSLVLELLQFPLPWRSLDWRDGVANTVGVLFSVGLMRAWERRRRGHG